MNVLLTRVIRFVLSPRAALAVSSRRTTLTAVLLLNVIPLNAHADNASIDALKLYAHSRIINYTQFQCFNRLISAESSWRIDARNGSHYGLGQMKNDQYRNLDGYRMIDWSIKYNLHRYGSHCNAYRFFMKHNYS
jgi:hypothetical protein